MTMNIDRLRMQEADRERTSSKGNQNKWFCPPSEGSGRTGIWIKEDGLGYEALAEILISRLLEKTNTDSFVRYRYESLQRGDQHLHGCSSHDFMEPEDDKLVSIERLFQTYRGESAAKAVLAYAEPVDRIRFVVDTVEKLTGLRQFGVYLKKILTIDAFFLNEDRHFHNLAVIQRKDGTFRECPIFDNGASLFSDVKGDYPLSLTFAQCRDRIQAKPFCADFDEQMDACEILYGGFVFRAEFTMGDVEQVLRDFQGIYEPEILERVRCVLRDQIRKYAYLF